MDKSISILSFTDRGDKLNIRLGSFFYKEYSVSSSLQSENDLSLEERTESAFKSDAIIFIGASGIAVRAIAPFVSRKDRDPAVLVIDELGKHVIPLLSGHLGGANDLALKTASFLNAEAVITTATDLNDVWAVDSWAKEQGYLIHNTDMIKAVSSALLKGEKVALISDIHDSAEEVFGGTPPENIVFNGTDLSIGILISPYLKEPFKDTLHLIPRCISLGTGCRKDTPYKRFRDFILDSLKEKGICLSAVSHIASIDIKKDEKALDEFSKEYDIPLLFFSADELNDLPSCFSFEESDFVKKETGCGNVCERSAVRAALLRSEKENTKLIIGKTKGEGMTLAAALSLKSRGQIYLIGLGPGSGETLTPEALRAMEDSSHIIGYKAYTDLVSFISEGKTVISSGMGQEKERCLKALELALKGKSVSLVCSGDSGIYGMASLMLEVSADHRDLKIMIIPGITAAIGGSAVLGSPLSNDFTCISLSDHLTDMEVIKKRLEAAAEADLVTVLYNPKSSVRRDHLNAAVNIFSGHRPPDTVCGYVKNIGRVGERSVICTLRDLPNEDIDMFTTVFIGNSDTVVINGRMVTKRGYKGDLRQKPL